MAKQFIVEGRGEFPVDMLRYDRCWPQSSDDAVNIFSKGNRRVALLTDAQDPTVKRWESFGWKMVSLERHYADLIAQTAVETAEQHRPLNAEEVCLLTGNHPHQWLQPENILKRIGYAKKDLQGDRSTAAMQDLVPLYKLLEELIKGMQERNQL